MRFTTPVGETVATEGLELDHITTLPASALPLASASAAWRCRRTCDEANRGRDTSGSHGDLRDVISETPNFSRWSR